jgi:hypothetical protein
VFKWKKSKAHSGKYFSDSFPIQNHLKQLDDSSPMLFIFALECASRNVQENQVGLKWNGTHHADDVSLLGDNTEIIKKDEETLIDACKEVGLDVNVEKTQYILVSCH